MRDNSPVSKKGNKKTQKIPQVYQILLNINFDDIFGAKTFSQD